MKKAKDQPESEPAELASLVGERIRKIRKEEGVKPRAFCFTSKEKQSVPDGERPVVHIAIVCGFWQGASESRVPIKQYLQKFPKWGRFGVTSVTPFLLLPVHPEGCTPAHRT